MRHAILIFGFAAACSEGGGGLSTPSAFDHDNAIAACVQAARCGFIGASEEKQCETDGVATLKQYPPVYSTTEAVNAKRLTFNATEAQKCVDANKNNGCSVDAYFSLFDKCANVFKPAVQPGGTCRDSIECVGGWCDQGMNGQSGCAGTCKANTATGMTCDPNAAHCNDTDFCDDTTMKCTARAKLSEACGSSPRCQFGLFCKGYVPEDTQTMTPEVKGACKSGGAAGDECTIYFFGNTDCGEGLFCDDSQSTAKCAKPAAMGADCGSYYGCVDPLDCIGVVFDQNTGAVTTKGKCGPYLDIGKSCPAMGETGCPLDSTCDAGMCKLGGQLGADCDPSGFGGGCGTNLYCDGATSTCAKTVPFGSACTPPMLDMNMFPIGGDPCHDGSCSDSEKKCVLVCM